MPRKLPDFIRGMLEYVEDTEAPRDFWIWSSIFTITSALQRKVWLPYGIENIYPNLYILIVAKPGKRKGLPASVAKRMLETIEVSVAVDSTSKRALTKELVEVAKVEAFTHKGITRQQAALAIVSKELSSLLAIDPKGMIEALTDLWDSHDEWKYKTSGEGHDYLYNVCINCLLCTTPTWLIDNLPPGAVGGGYTSRHIMVTGDRKYKSVAIPPEPPESLYRKLVNDLQHIHGLKGPFQWGEGTEEFFTSWYDKEVPEFQRKVKDDRMHGFLERIHIMALKTAMALRTSYSDDLIITTDDMGKAIELVQRVLIHGPEALGAYGRSRMGPDIQRILGQLQMVKEISINDLLAMNINHVNLTEMREILETMDASGVVKMLTDQHGKIIVKFVGKRHETI